MLLLMMISFELLCFAFSCWFFFTFFVWHGHQSLGMSEVQEFFGLWILTMQLRFRCKQEIWNHGVSTVETQQLTTETHFLLFIIACGYQWDALECMVLSHVPFHVSWKIGSQVVGLEIKCEIEEHQICFYPSYDLCMPIRNGSPKRKKKGKMFFNQLKKLLLCSCINSY